MALVEDQVECIDEQRRREQRWLEMAERRRSRQDRMLAIIRQTRRMKGCSWAMTIEWDEVAVLYDDGHIVHQGVDVVGIDGINIRQPSSILEFDCL